MFVFPLWHLALWSQVFATKTRSKANTLKRDDDDGASSASISDEYIHTHRDIESLGVVTLGKVLGRRPKLTVECECVCLSLSVYLSAELIISFRNDSEVWRWHCLRAAAAQSNINPLRDDDDADGMYTRSIYSIVVAHRVRGALWANWIAREFSISIPFLIYPCDDG